jgi:spoIIIJ-associated protein
VKAAEILCGAATPVANFSKLFTFAMPIEDKVAAAHRINDFLKQLFAAGGFRLKYRITVEPKFTDGRQLEMPDILVELAGLDSDLVLERNAELLRSFEHMAQEMLRLSYDDHGKVSFDCRNYRATRLHELKTAADVAAERVRKTGLPYEFSPMSSHERRVLHLALAQQEDLKTESSGLGGRRFVVVYPKNYQPKPKIQAPSGLRPPPAI